jgi:imidazolonepropionase-like amidohydrolase
MRPDLGRIRIGCVGDIIIFDGDALADPSAVWDESRSRTVIQAGVVK